jgi:hypothetical protein
MFHSGGRDSVVGIANRYGLDGPGIESRWWRDFRHTSRPALGPTQRLHNKHRVTPTVNRPRRGVNHHPHLAPSLESTAIPVLPLCAIMACYRVDFTFHSDCTKFWRQIILWGSWSIIYVRRRLWNCSNMKCGAIKCTRKMLMFRRNLPNPSSR